MLNIEGTCFKTQDICQIHHFIGLNLNLGQIFFFFWNFLVVDFAILSPPATPVDSVNISIYEHTSKIVQVLNIPGRERVKLFLKKRSEKTGFPKW